jgi:two-component system sensor kinase FixL
VVEARPGEQRGGVEIEVRDSGPGISESVSDLIFEPFYTTKSNGMGIGLALSRTIVEAHGARLRLDRTNRHVGAVFRFTLQQA